MKTAKEMRAIFAACENNIRDIMKASEAEAIYRSESGHRDARIYVPQNIQWKVMEQLEKLGYEILREAGNSSSIKFSW